MSWRLLLQLMMPRQLEYGSHLVLEEVVQDLIAGRGRYWVVSIDPVVLTSAARKNP